MPDDTHQVFYVPVFGWSPDKIALWGALQERINEIVKAEGHRMERWRDVAPVAVGLAITLFPDMDDDARLALVMDVMRDLGRIVELIQADGCPA